MVRLAQSALCGNDNTKVQIKDHQYKIESRSYPPMLHSNCTMDMTKNGYGGVMNLCDG